MDEDDHKSLLRTIRVLVIGLALGAAVFAVAMGVEALPAEKPFLADWPL